MDDLLSEKLIQWEKRNGTWVPYEKLYVLDDAKKKIKARSILYDLASTGDGTNVLTELFGKKDVFENPKPVELLKFIIQRTCFDDSLVLDFFAGSCTLGHAVIEENKNASRSIAYICVQLPEPLKEDSVAANMGYKTIAEVGYERLKKVIRKVSRNDGIRKYKLTRSNFIMWDSKAVDNVEKMEDMFEKFSSPLYKDWTIESLRTEVMLLEGFPLDSHIENIKTKKNNVYKISSSLCEHNLLVCLDDKVSRETITQAEIGEHDVFVCLDSAISDEDKLRLSDKGLLKTI